MEPDNKILNVSALIREINLNRPLKKFAEHEIFPYIERYHKNPLFQHKRAPNSFTDQLSTIPSELKRRKHDHHIHSSTLRYKVSKNFATRFIEKVRNELNESERTKKRERLTIPIKSNKKPTKQSENAGIAINTLCVLSTKVPNNYRYSYDKRDSFLDYSADFERIIMPYAENPMREGYFSDLSLTEPSTKDASINT
jgi:hypothetical protein